MNSCELRDSMNERAETHSLDDALNFNVLARIGGAAWL